MIATRRGTTRSQSVVAGCSVIGMHAEVHPTSQTTPSQSLPDGDSSSIPTGEPNRLVRDSIELNQRSA